MNACVFIGLVCFLMCVLTSDSETAGVPDAWHHLRRMFKVWCVKKDLLQMPRNVDIKQKQSVLN